MVESSIKSELIGSAVFYDDRMVGTLTGEQTRVWCMATGQFGHGEISLPNPFGEGMLTLKLKQAGACKDNGKHRRCISQRPDRGAAQCIFGGLCRNGKLRNAGQKEEIAAYVQQRLQEDLEEISRNLQHGAWMGTALGRQLRKFQNAAGLGGLSMAGVKKTAAGDGNAQRICVPVPSGVRRGTMIAVLIGLGLLGYCGGYALRQFREKKAGAGGCCPPCAWRMQRCWLDDYAVKMKRRRNFLRLF